MDSRTKQVFCFFHFIHWIDFMVTLYILYKCYKYVIFKNIISNVLYVNIFAWHLETENNVYHIFYWISVSFLILCILRSRTYTFENTSSLCLLLDHFVKKNETVFYCHTPNHHTPSPPPLHTRVKYWQRLLRAGSALSHYARTYS